MDPRRHMVSGLVLTSTQHNSWFCMGCPASTWGFSRFSGFICFSGWSFLRENNGLERLQNQCQCQASFTWLLTRRTYHDLPKVTIVIQDFPWWCGANWRHNLCGVVAYQGLPPGWGWCGQLRELRSSESETRAPAGAMAIFLQLQSASTWDFFSLAHLALESLEHCYF